MRFEPGKLEVVPLSALNLAGVIQVAESLEEAPHWRADSYLELVDRNAAARRTGLVANYRETIEPEVVGFAIARMIPPEAELESIGVAAAFQRLGIGQRLMRLLLEELGRSGILRLYLEVRASNTSALTFYDSVGFGKTGTRPGYYTDPIEDAVLMERRVS